MGFLGGRFTPSDCRNQLLRLSFTSAETVLVLGCRPLHINMHETDERGAVPAEELPCTSISPALRSCLRCLMELSRNVSVQNTFFFFSFFSGVLFVETETLPQKCAESPGNSPGGRRKTALTQRAGTSTGAHPRGSGLPLGLVWNQTVSPIPGVPQATDAHKQVNGTYLLKPRGTQRYFRIKFNSYRVIFGCGRDFSIDRGVKINHLSSELPV